ncbi:hypothetical protein KIPB_000457 [Kipferlia bialata]|uniref:Uncharacterized protein n=1 Tax=Kipferlia bialata TaxID=797122 RepID=A0A9K3CP56_9EUKA|nr:hypothetical protein KIPB_000457 [Kipferlia bialata]|eukprot:g457.t1
MEVAGDREKSGSSSVSEASATLGAQIYQAQHTLTGVCDSHSARLDALETETIPTMQADIKSTTSVSSQAMPRLEAEAALDTLSQTHTQGVQTVQAAVDAAVTKAAAGLTEVRQEGERERAALKEEAQAATAELKASVQSDIAAVQAEATRTASALRDTTTSLSTHVSASACALAKVEGDMADRTEGVRQEVLSLQTRLAEERQTERETLTGYCDTAVTSLRSDLSASLASASAQSLSDRQRIEREAAERDAAARAESTSALESLTRDHTSLSTCHTLLEERVGALDTGVEASLAKVTESLQALAETHKGDVETLRASAVVSAQESEDRDDALQTSVCEVAEILTALSTQVEGVSMETVLSHTQAVRADLEAQVADAAKVSAERSYLLASEAEREREAVAKSLQAGTDSVSALSSALQTLDDKAMRGIAAVKTETQDRCLAVEAAAEAGLRTGREERERDMAKQDLSLSVIRDDLSTYEASLAGSVAALDAQVNAAIESTRAETLDRIAAAQDGIRVLSEQTDSRLKALGQRAAAEIVSVGASVSELKNTVARRLVELREGAETEQRDREALARSVQERQDKWETQGHKAHADLAATLAAQQAEMQTGLDVRVGAIEASLSSLSSNQAELLSDTERVRQELVRSVHDTQDSFRQSIGTVRSEINDVSEQSTECAANINAMEAMLSSTRSRSEAVSREIQGSVHKLTSRVADSGHRWREMGATLDARFIEVKNSVALLERRVKHV